MTIGALTVCFFFLLLYSSQEPPFIGDAVVYLSTLIEANQISHSQS